MGNRLVKIFEGGVIGAVLWVAAMAGAPRVIQAQEERRLPLMVERLHTVRAAIGHYEADHGGLRPGQTEAGGAVTAEGFAGALAGERKDGSGPYLARLPENPFIAEQAERRNLVIAGGEKDGARSAWRFDPVTGWFGAGDSEFHKAY